MRDSLSESPESYFLKRYFHLLENAQIRYAVMRNYNSLPYSLEGSDLDLITYPEYANQVIEITNQAVRESGGVPIGIAKSIGIYKIFVIGMNKSIENQWWGIRIDINIGLFFKGQPIVCEESKWPARKHNNISVLPDEYAGLFGCLKEILNNKFLPKRYLDDARCAIEKEWANIQQLLSPLGEKTLCQLNELLLSDKYAFIQKAACHKIRKTFLWHHMSRKPFQSIKALISYEMAKVVRVLRPPGIVIAVLGTDGSGKSTLINSLLPFLEAATHNAVFLMHLRPGLLPPLSRLKGKNAIICKPVVMPHLSKASGNIGSFFRLSYLVIDYLLGYWILIRPIIAKQPAVVIFDRYAHDIILDPRRLRIALSRKLRNWFFRLVPKPDLIFCLCADPAVISERKNELPAKEIARQVTELKKIADGDPCKVVIDTGNAIEQSTNLMLNALFRFLKSESSSKLF